MRVIAQLLLFMLVVYGGFDCVRPARLPTANPLDIARYEERPAELQCLREIYVLFDSRFTMEERQAMEATYPEFHMLGLRPEIKTTSSVYLFNLYVLRWNGGINSGSLGLFEHHSSFVRVDAEAMASRQQLQTVFMHEFGHWLGMSHVCTGREAIVRRDCSPVGRGAAILNPFSDPLMPPRFTVLDKLEFYRSSNQ